MNFGYYVINKFKSFLKSNSENKYFSKCIIHSIEYSFTSGLLKEDASLIRLRSGWAKRTSGWAKVDPPGISSITTSCWRSNNRKFKYFGMIWWHFVSIFTLSKKMFFNGNCHLYWHTPERRWNWPQIEKNDQWINREIILKRLKFEVWNKHLMMI